MVSLLKWLGLSRPAARETANQATGRRGEREAESFLRREKKFRIVVRNWRWKKGEIDLVCWDRQVLVFVEVKTRAADASVPGYYAVDQKKKDILRWVCGQYLQQLKKKPATFRFDVVEVSVSPVGESEILHFENIPLFPKGYHWGKL